ncbi:hypothetical protein BDZ89DRAFT_1169695 [Hymenopellis radicata]|nr:hypothetical protein BDZ89DRAFT_1169695 [Hymenopellis radicata]
MISAKNWIRFGSRPLSGTRLWHYAHVSWIREMRRRLRRLPTPPHFRTASFKTSVFWTRISHRLQRDVASPAGLFSWGKV